MAFASAEPYPYVAVGQDVREVLTEFGKNLGLGIRVSDAVKGKVALPPSTMPPREFLDRLASDMGFLWYFDGLTLHVVGLDEAENHLLELRRVSLADLRKALDQLGLADPRYPLRGTATMA